MIILLARPALAGLGVMALWNGIVTDICGFASVTYLQALGLFVLGQLLSAGFILLLGGVHVLLFHHRDWHGRWHRMTDQQRREFILRRQKQFGFHHFRPTGEDDTQ